MRYIDESCEIIHNKQISSDTWECRIKTKLDKNVQAGQFLNVLVEVEGTILRRVFAITHLTDSTYDFIYTVVGKGTKWLSEQKVGKLLNVLAPFGKGFPIHENKKILLVCGELGIPPHYMYAKQNHTKSEIDILLWMNNDTKDFYANAFENISNKIHKTKTRNEFFKFIEKHQKDYDLIFCSDDDEGLVKIQEINPDNCFMHLEARMACGFGVCNACSVQLPDGRVRKICYHGPLFGIKEVKIDG